MSPLSGSIEDFYTADAAAYAALSEDRDFATQARFLASEVIGEGGRYLELFAGPARHSIELGRRHGITCVALDASSDMRRIALATGFPAPDRYHVMRLPMLPPHEARGDVITGASILRYSVGYLGPQELVALLQGLELRLAPKARLVFELHDLDMVRSDFRELAIRDRIVRGPNGQGWRCVWPAAPLRWSADDWVVEMDVLIQALDGDRVTAERRCVSVERIYAAGEIASLGAIAGGWRSVPVATDAFPGSRMVMIERT